MKDLLFHPSPGEMAPEWVPLKKTLPKPLRSQNKKAGSESGQDLWLITLSDLLLLLMLFFVLLFGLTFQQQAQESPSLPPGADPMKSVETQRPPFPDSNPKEILSSLETDLRAISGDRTGQGEVTVTRQADRLVLTFPERIVFDPGRAKLKGSAQPILHKVASLVSTHPYLLMEIQGHTDDRPINNDRYPSNWELSVDRATQVAKALLTLGLGPAQISVKGFGEYRSLHANDNAANRQKNRRVEIQFFLAPRS